MTYKAIKNIMICAVLLAGFFLGGCNQQSEGERTPGKKTGSDNSTPMPTPAGQSTPSGQPTPNPVPGGATSSGTCLDQWKAYTTYFTVGRAIKFNTSVLAQGQNFPATHDEKILTSDDSAVSRQVNLYSTNAIASQIIAQIKIPNPIVLKKASFLSACEGSAGKSQPVFTYGGDSAKLIETKVESINLATGPVSAQYSLFLAQVTIGSQRVEANIKIWSSLKTPGLILKQIFVLTNVPIVGQATVMDELISQ